ncbi:hypothetical protein BCR33DRAFT_344165 [Rhizoclosmatium globosum]|uniref:Uncharacterized protein n=1 Tax=Rhizoclosmatium globosum TaxID=329046 RepID=A0A1Y2C2R9_9FUNG|nr:hypothetical protein BCR33DRAFT_344165 [Rhizoclosmatium globosum]|eukprot:ORY41319.1 hypothetical protein BCR33DRAFT_344165 [Rhizoclosmatium globosum]
MDAAVIANPAASHNINKFFQDIKRNRFSPFADSTDLKNELEQLSKYVTVPPQFPTQSMAASPATSATPPPMTNHYISLGVAPISPAISGHPLDSFSNADLVSIDDFLNSVSATFDVPAKTFGLGGNAAIKNETGVFDNLFAFPNQQQAGYQQQSQQPLFQQPVFQQHPTFHQQPMFQQQPQQSFFNQPQSQQYPPQMYQQQQPQFQQPFIPSQPAPQQQLQYQQSQQFNPYQTYTNTNNPYGNQSPQLPRMLQTSVPQMAPAAPRPDIPQLPSFKEICPLNHPACKHSSTPPGSPTTTTTWTLTETHRLRQVHLMLRCLFLDMESFFHRRWGCLRLQRGRRKGMEMR